jgi:hypothetical protein
VGVEHFGSYKTKAPNLSRVVLVSEPLNFRFRNPACTVQITEAH